MGMTDGKRADMEDVPINRNIPPQCVIGECGCCNLTTHERWTIGCNREVEHGN